VDDDADIRLNMRTAHGIYRTLQMYVEEADRGGFDEEIDMDFRSVRPSLLSVANPNNQGVLLGTGTSSLMLSLLPGKVLKVCQEHKVGADNRSQKYSATQEIVKSPLNHSWPLGDGITEPRNLISTRRMKG